MKCGGGRDEEVVGICLIVAVWFVGRGERSVGLGDWTCSLSLSEFEPEADKDEAADDGEEEMVIAS